MIGVVAPWLVLLLHEVFGSHRLLHVAINDYRLLVVATRDYVLLPEGFQ